MKFRLVLFVLIFFPVSPILAQKNAPIGPASLSPEDILLRQVQSKHDQQNPSQDLNEQVRSLFRLPRTITDYLLGPGDEIELTVVGIPGLDKKVFALDSQGTVSVPYLGQVELMGLTTRDVESKIAKLFAVSLLEDPQVTVGVAQYRSQYFYMMGAVHKPGKYPLTQSTDVLDALALAEGLNEKAGSIIKIYRYSQRQISQSALPIANGGKQGVEAANNPDPSNALEISLPDLLKNGHDINGAGIFPGDVVEVPERRERNYYVLGDIQRPGAFPMPNAGRMALSQALGNAGGMLRTASGKKTMVIRQRAGETLPEQIRVNAYSVLKGDIKDIELLENDIVLVPGSTSKTLGKNFLNGANGFLSTLLLLGLH